MYQSDLALFRARQRTLSSLRTNSSPDRILARSWPVVCGEVLDHLLLAEALNRRDIAELIDMAKSGSRPYLKRTFADMNVSMAYIPKSMLPFLEVPFRLLSMVVPRSAGEFLTRYRLVPAQSPDVGTPTQRSSHRRTAPRARSSLQDGGSL
jgi:hypothetical protein